MLRLCWAARQSGGQTGVLVFPAPRAPRAPSGLSFTTSHHQSGPLTVDGEIWPGRGCCRERADRTNTETQLQFTTTQCFMPKTNNNIWVPKYFKWRENFYGECQHVVTVIIDSCIEGRNVVLARVRASVINCVVSWFR